MLRYLAEFDVRSDQPASRPPYAEEVLPAVEQQQLWLAVQPFVLRISLNAGTLAGQLVGLPEMTSDDWRIPRLLADAQTQILEAHDTTLAAIRQTLELGFMQHETARQIADQLRLTVRQVYAGRAWTIARTEIARASNLAALERYQEAGVSTVLVSDETVCGWTRHDDEDKANGTLRTVIAARQFPLSHPNCGRRLLPVR